MEKDSALYQLMDTRMNGVMNGIVSSDGEYQAILRKSDIYSGELDRMDLSKEIRLQSHVFWEMPADRSKRNDNRIVTAKCQTGRFMKCFRTGDNSYKEQEKAACICVCGRQHDCTHNSGRKISI